MGVYHVGIHVLWYCHAVKYFWKVFNSISVTLNITHHFLLLACWLELHRSGAKKTAGPALLADRMILSNCKTHMSNCFFSQYINGYLNFKILLVWNKQLRTAIWDQVGSCFFDKAYLPYNQIDNDCAPYLHPASQIDLMITITDN